MGLRRRRRRRRRAAQNLWLGFVLLMVLDLASHWFQMYSSLLENRHHKVRPCVLSDSGGVCLLLRRDGVAETTVVVAPVATAGGERLRPVPGQLLLHALLVLRLLLRGR